MKMGVPKSLASFAPNFYRTWNKVHHPNVLQVLRVFPKETKYCHPSQRKLCPMELQPFLAPPLWPGCSIEVETQTRKMFIS
jgi:hypothetical protein